MENKSVNTQNQKMKVIVLGLGLIFILGFLFFWFEYRPSQIRKQCYQKTQTGFASVLPENVKMAEYESCLHSFGI